MKHFSLIAVKVLKIVFELGCRNCSIINPFQLFTLQTPKREALVVCYLGMICSVCAAQAYFMSTFPNPLVLVVPGILLDHTSTVLLKY